MQCCRWTRRKCRAHIRSSSARGNHHRHRKTPRRSACPRRTSPRDRRFQRPLSRTHQHHCNDRACTRASSQCLVGKQTWGLHPPAPASRCRENPSNRSARTAHHTSCRNKHRRRNGRSHTRRCWHKTRPHRRRSWQCLRSRNRGRWYGRTRFPKSARRTHRSTRTRS